MKKTLVALLVLCTAVFSQDKKSDFGTGSMIANAGLSFSAFGLGYGGTFEFGLTDNIGVQAGFSLNSYETGNQTWSMSPIDVWGTYHTDAIGFGDEGYYMAGVSFVVFDVEVGASSEDATGTFIGFGYGATKEINKSLDFYFEGRYRLGTFETDTYSLTAAWYSIGAGISYSL
jgi:hypothetical protein